MAILSRLECQRTGGEHVWLCQSKCCFYEQFILYFLCYSSSECNQYLFELTVFACGSVQWLLTLLIIIFLLLDCIIMEFEVMLYNGSKVICLKGSNLSHITEHLHRWKQYAVVFPRDPYWVLYYFCYISTTCLMFVKIPSHFYLLMIQTYL